MRIELQDVRLYPLILLRLPGESDAHHETHRREPKMTKKLLLAVFVLGMFSVGAQAHDSQPVDPEVSTHSGGTDAAGCHTNHKTGGYHCH